MGWEYLWQWVTPRQLLIPAKNDNELSQANPPIHEFYLISTENGTTQHYTFHLPRAYAFGLILRGWVGRPIYNPKLEYAIYPWVNNDFSNEGLLLWDTQQERIVWEQDRWGWPIEYAGIDWSPNGNVAVVTAPPIGSNNLWAAELLEISTTGIVTQLTHLEQSYSEYMLRAPKWSPDGRYIAFTYKSGTPTAPDPASLFVYDTQTQAVIDYCFDAVRDLAFAESALWWSPASDQIAFESTSGGVFVIDVATGKAQKLPYTLLAGWVPWTKVP